MTTQSGELLLRNGKRVWMQTLPLEAYWKANPPRPYMIAKKTSAWRGYIGEWEISDRRLYLKKFEATAWKTSNDWIGELGLNDLWFSASLRGDSVAQIITKLANLPEIAHGARRRAARIVEALAQKLLAQGALTPDAYGQDLYKAAVDAFGACLTKEQKPISLASLFPDSTSGVFADWYAGTLCIGEGEWLDYRHGGLFGTYEFTRLIEIRDGCVVNEELRQNEAP